MTLSNADRAGLIAIVAVFLLASIRLLFKSISDTRPAARISQRLHNLNTDVQGDFAPPAEEEEAVVARHRDQAILPRLLGGLRVWVQTADPVLLSSVVLGALAAGVLTFGVSRWLLDLPATAQPVTAAAATLTMLVFALPMLKDSKARKFLENFPDALEYVIRSVRAGLPVAQAIRLASKEVKGPVAREFREIADSLALGMDMREAFDKPTRRVAIPDFTFFAVTLVLQRETGGPLTETLENLATIIRHRHDLRVKAKALTAEGRITAKIIGALPFATIGAVNFLAPDYAHFLFADPAGRTILTAAGLLLLIGMLIVNRMTRMKA